MSADTCSFSSLPPLFCPFCGRPEHGSVACDSFNGSVSVWPPSPEVLADAASFYAEEQAAEERASYPYRWRLRRYLGERHGQPCAIIARAVGVLPCRNICVEFADGYRVVTSRWAVRKR